MQADWDKKSVFIHKCSTSGEKKIPEKELSFIAIKNLISLKTPTALVFHAQSSLPYLIFFKLLNKIYKKNNFNVVYDIHDLHEDSDKSLRGKIRYWILRFFEKRVFLDENIKKITVSQGLSEELSNCYTPMSKPLVVYNVARTNLSNVPNTRTKDLVFFGSKERVPFELFETLKEENLKLDIFGKGITKEWLEEESKISKLDFINVFGEYDPKNMQFLLDYKYLILYYPKGNSKNFIYSMPNKYFQALDSGLKVVLSSNFEEMITFSKRINNFYIELKSASDLKRLLNSSSDMSENEARSMLEETLFASKQNYLLATII